MAVVDIGNAHSYLSTRIEFGRVVFVKWVANFFSFMGPNQAVKNGIGFRFARDNFISWFDAW